MYFIKLSLYLSILTIVARTCGSAILHGHGDANTSKLTTFEPSLHRPDPNYRLEIDGTDITNDVFSSRALQERNWVPRPSLTRHVDTPDDGPYSLSFYQDHLLQWIFGDDDNHFNISLSTCLSKYDVVGRYRFADGIVENGVTGKRIQDDLGFTTGAGSIEQYAARTIRNAEATLKSAHVLLGDRIVCGLGGDLVGFNNFNRALLARQGTRLAWVGVSGTIVILTILGLVLSSSDWSFGLKVGLGALIASMTIIINGLIQQAQARGYLAGPEAYIANVWLATCNRVIFQSQQSPALNGPCVPEIQLTSVVERVGSFSNPDLGVAALSEDEGYGLDCIAP